MCLTRPALALEITEPEAISEGSDTTSELLQRFEPLNDDSYLPVTNNQDSGELIAPPLTTLVSQLDDVSPPPTGISQATVPGSPATGTRPSSASYHPDIVQQLMYGIRDSVKQSPRARQFIDRWNQTQFSQRLLPAPEAVTRVAALPTEQPPQRSTSPDQAQGGDIDQSAETKKIVDGWIARLTHPLTITIVFSLLSVRFIFGFIRRRST